MRTRTTSCTLAFAALALGVSTLSISTGCQSASIAMWEKLGYAKRDQLVEKVKDARDSQQAAKEQFQTALEQFQSLTGFQGGELEAKYKKLQKEYDRSRTAASLVKTRIDSTVGVADALFGEWERELGLYTDPSLRASSQRQLDDTRRQYDRLITAMRQAESKMEPVLKSFNDRVLYLKHNLNAQAIASLSGDVRMIEGDVARLITEMNASIAEADAFIGNMK